MRSTLIVKYDFILALRSQIFEYLGETYYRHALESVEPARSEKKRKTHGVFSYGNILLLLTFLKVLGWLGHILAPAFGPGL